MSNPLATLTVGSWIVTDRGDCYQIASVEKCGRQVEALRVGKYGRVSFIDNTLSFGSRAEGRPVRPATETDLAAWREREARKKAEAEAEAEEWHRDTRIRDHSRKLLAACELFLKYDAENCQTGPTSYEDVRAAILAAVREAAPHSEYAK